MGYYSEEIRKAHEVLHEEYRAAVLELAHIVAEEAKTLSGSELQNKVREGVRKTRWHSDERYACQCLRYSKNRPGVLSEIPNKKLQTQALMAMTYDVLAEINSPENSWQA